MATVVGHEGEVQDEHRGRAATRGASVGFFVDCFDIYLPIVALGPANAYFFPDNLSASTTAMLNGMIFVATLLGRPIGAFVFGHMADRRGRKFTTVFSVLGFGLGTLLIALLPGHAAWGLAAPVVLIVLRFVSGIFMGGEYTAAIPLAMEASPQRRRGFYGGMITFAFPTAYIAISLITVALLSVLDASGPTSDYAVWGWRITFGIGALMALAFAWWYAVSVEESESWRDASARRRENPLRVLFGARYRRTFLQVMLLMVGVWFATNVGTAMLPAALKTVDELDSSSLTWVLIVAEGGLAVALPLLGALSQRVGRKPFLIAAGLVTVVVPSLAWYLLVERVMTGFVPIAALSVLVVVGGLCAYGATASYICERFPAEIRASGYGLGYSLALVVPAFYPFIQLGLAGAVPATHSPILFLVLGGILITVAGCWGPETREVRL